MSLKPVCFLLSLCCAGSASALGLGELTLRSSLGQPLHATVTLIDTPAEITATCFSLDSGKQGIAPMPQAQLSLQRAGDQTLLHIRTLEPVNDPVAQFVLTSDCEARLQREYTVLLDPPALLAPAPGMAEPGIAAPPAAAAPAPRPGRPQRQAIRSSVAATPPSARPTEPASPNARMVRADPAPRLVLSGKRGSANTPFALRLDTNLPDLARSRSEGLTATELSDENTALARKLAHLEGQLVELQKRNEELEARRPPAPAKITPPPEMPAQWPRYLLIAVLIGTGIALVAWLLRRSPSPRPVLMDEAPWTQQPDVPTMPMRAPVPATEPEPAPERMLEISEPPRDEGTELKEDILDQAEVFMAHGHGDLAVHLLQEHLREAPTESPVPWLLLLDLLHREGNTDGYDAASAECRRHFNINLAGHPISQDSEPGPGLEAYPHLLEQLVKVWSTPGIDAFFQDLIYDNRGGTRMGFEPGAYREILLLRAISRDVLPLAA